MSFLSRYGLGRHHKGRRMPDYIVLPAAILFYFLLMKFVLPRFGVPT